ncbi:MAG: MGMT family protein [Actinobacteria bacterium]|nr:MGMT family protein [Actinomycetota bacterium]
MPTEPPFAERVLRLVERIPPGRVMSYGDVADFLGSRAPRQVGAVLARDGGGVPWHRVLRADGTPAAPLAERQLALLAAEGVPVRDGRVDIRRFRWDGRTGG